MVPKCFVLSLVFNLSIFDTSPQNKNNTKKLMRIMFSENRQHHIQEAEALTPKGNKIWNELQQEYAEKYESG